MSTTTHSSQKNFPSPKEESNTDSSPRWRNLAKRSSLWEYCSHKECNGVMCYALSVHNCRRHFSARSSTSTVKAHLSNHGFFAQDEQLTLKADGRLVMEPVKPILQRQTEFFTTLCSWIAEAGFPFATVENYFFKEMISVCDPALTLPTRTTVSSEINKMPKCCEKNTRNSSEHPRNDKAYQLYQWWLVVVTSVSRLLVFDHTFVDKEWKINNFHWISSSSPTYKMGRRHLKYYRT